MAVTGGIIELQAHAKSVQGFARKLAKPVAPLLKILVQVLVGFTKTEVFAKGQDPDGRAWPRLKWPRLRSGGNDQPLRDTGLLMSSLTGQGRGADKNVAEISGSTLIWGTRATHAHIHQHGGPIVPTGGRKFLAIPATVQAARAGSPLKWPEGSLRPIIGKKGGVLVEAPKESQTKALAKAKTQRSDATKRIRNLEKEIGNLSRGKGKARERAMLRHRFRIRVLQIKLKAARKAIGKHSAAGTVQYYLARRVMIQARPFIGFGIKAIDRCLQAVRDYYGWDDRGQVGAEYRPLEGSDGA